MNYPTRKPDPREDELINRLDAVQRQFKVLADDVKHSDERNQNQINQAGNSMDVAYMWLQRAILALRE